MFFHLSSGMPPLFFVNFPSLIIHGIHVIPLFIRMMNKLTYSLLFVVMTAFTSCSDHGLSTYFEHPQPKGEKDLRAFKKGHTGLYRIPGMKNRTILILPDKVIFHYLKPVSRPPEGYRRSEITLPVKKIFGGKDLTDIFSNDTSVRKDPEDPQTITILLTHEDDTVFVMDEDHVLRYSQKIYFLNKRRHGAWEVSLLRFPGEGKATIHKLCNSSDPPSDISKYTKTRTVKNPEGKITSFMIDPTRKELMNLIRNHILKECSEIEVDVHEIIIDPDLFSKDLLKDTSKDTTLHEPLPTDTTGPSK